MHVSSKLFAATYSYWQHRKSNGSKNRYFFKFTNCFECIFTFRCLSEHSYDYSCVLCGFHPQILIMDLNRKIAFRCAAEKFQISENYCKDDHDFVNVEDFWRRVELCMILRGYPGCTVEKFKIEPSLFDWAPYIGKLTRKNNNIYNAEHRKVNPVT